MQAFARSLNRNSTHTCVCMCICVPMYNESFLYLFSNLVIELLQRARERARNENPIDSYILCPALPKHFEEYSINADVCNSRCGCINKTSSLEGKIV